MGSDSTRHPLAGVSQDRFACSVRLVELVPGVLLGEHWELRADLITAENAELSWLFDEGTIGAATRRWLRRSLDLDITRLAGRPR